MKSQKRKSSAGPPLNPGEDFYLENGRMVFTEAFLRRRGICCESGCRHCPYGFGPAGLQRKLEAERENR
jgi:hypothetical protein